MALNSVGFASVEDLEQYVFVHGACRVLPLSTLATDPALLAETQGFSQLAAAPPPPPPDEKYQARKLELANARGEIARLQSELAHARAELAREQLTHGEDKAKIDDLLGETAALRSVLREAMDPDEAEAMRGRIEEDGEVIGEWFVEVERLDAKVKYLNACVAHLTGREVEGEEDEGECELERDVTAEQEPEEGSGAGVAMAVDEEASAARTVCVPLSFRDSQWHHDEALFRLAPDTPVASPPARLAPSQRDAAQPCPSPQHPTGLHLSQLSADPTSSATVVVPSPNPTPAQTKVIPPPIAGPVDETPAARGHQKRLDNYPALLLDYYARRKKLFGLQQYIDGNLKWLQKRSDAPPPSTLIPRFLADVDLPDYPEDTVALIQGMDPAVLMKTYADLRAANEKSKKAFSIGDKCKAELKKIKAVLEAEDAAKVAARGIVTQSPDRKLTKRRRKVGGTSAGGSGSKADDDPRRSPRKHASSHKADRTRSSASKSQASTQAVPPRRTSPRKSTLQQTGSSALPSTSWPSHHSQLEYSGDVIQETPKKRKRPTDLFGILSEAASISSRARPSSPSRSSPGRGENTIPSQRMDLDGEEQSEEEPDTLDEDTIPPIDFGRPLYARSTAAFPPPSQIPRPSTSNHPFAPISSSSQHMSPPPLPHPCHPHLDPFAPDTSQSQQSSSPPPGLVLPFDPPHSSHRPQPPKSSQEIDSRVVLPLPRASQRPRRPPTPVALSSAPPTTYRPPRDNASPSVSKKRSDLDHKKPAAQVEKEEQDDHEDDEDEDEDEDADEDADDDVEPPFPSAFAFGLMGTPPEPAPDWAAVAKQEEKLKKRRLAGAAAKEKEGSKGKGKQRAREEEVEESSGGTKLAEKKPKRFVQQKLEEEDRKAREMERAGEKAKAKELAKLKKRAEEAAAREERRQREGDEDEEHDEAPEEYDIDAGPSASDPMGTKWMRKMQAKRHVDVVRTKAGDKA